MTQSSPVDHDDGSLLSTQISTIQNLLDSLSNHHHHHSSQQHHDMKQQQHMMTHDHHYHLTHNNNEQSPFISKQFKSRVATFTAKNWYHKPFAIRPPVCARYGYACVDVDVIQCVDCGVMLSFRLPSFLSSYCDDDDDKNRSKKDHSDKNCLIVKKLCDGFIQKMKNAHCRTSCAYHHQSSPFQMLLFGHQFTYHENEDASSVVYNAGRMHRAKFLLRLKQVMSLSGSYLMFHERFMQVYVQTNRKMIESIMSVMFSSEQLQREREWLERCVWIAIFGWKVRPLLLNSATAQTMMLSSADGSQKQSKNNHVDDSVKCLYCEYCQVRVPLLVVNNNNKVVFDPCDAHRFWCPCIHGSPPMDESYPVVNTTALANTVGGDGQTIELRIPEQLPGWKQVFSAIQTIKDVDDPFHLKSESVDCFQKLRHANLLLNSTLSPFYLKHMNRKKELRRLLDERERAQNPPSIQEPEQVIGPTETQIDEQINDQVRAPTASSAIESTVAEPREETEQAIVVGEQVELQPQESTATKTKSTTLPIQPEEVPREEEVSSEPLDTDELEFESHDSNLLTPSPVIEPNEGSQTPLLENEDESMDNQTDDESSTPPPMSKKLMEKQPEKPATTGRVILLPTSNSSSTIQQPQNNNPNTRPKPSASQEVAPPQSTSSNKGNTRGSRATRGYRGKRKLSNQSASNRGKKAKR